MEQSKSPCPGFGKCPFRDEDKATDGQDTCAAKDVGGIKEPRQIDTTQHDNENRYKAIVEAFDGFIYICSRDYRVEFMNPRLIERTGYDGTGEYCYKVLHERNSVCPWCVNERVFRGETVRWEVQSPKDQRWYYAVNTPIYHSDGRVSKQAMIQDITEFKRTEEALRQAHAELERRVEERTAHLKQANEQLLREIEERGEVEERLRESEARFLAFMQHLPGGAVIRDLQGRYLFANKAWEKAFSKENWQGKNLEEIWPKGTAQWMRELDHKAVACGEPVETLITLHQEDGPHSWLINRFPIMDKEGQVVLVGSAGVDVTTRQRAEAALEEERQRLFSLLDELPVYVYLHGPDHTIRFANRVFREHFGEPDGKSCYEILRGSSQPCENCSTDRVFATRSPQEVHWASPSGRIYQLHSYPFADVDGSLLCLKVGIDITERKKTEAEIRLNEARLAGLLRISQYSPTSIQELLDYAMEEAIALTGSKIGYIYFYDEATQTFTLNTWSKDVMQLCTIAEPQTIYHLEKTGIWGEAVRQARPIMVNDFQAPHPLKKGHPEGHAPIYKFLTIPVTSGNSIIAVVGVANKTTDYDDADVRQLTLMMDAVWKIVERHQSQEALKESEKRFRQLVEHAADALILHDKGKIIEVNQHTCNSLGYSREELLKMAVADVEVKLSSDELLKFWEQEIESPVTIDGVHRRKDGSSFPVEVRVARFMYGGRPLRLALARDITKRLAAEEALRESESGYRQLVMAAPFGISIIGRNGQYKYLNPKFEELFGYSLADIPTGRDWFDRAYPDPAYRSLVRADWQEEFQRPRTGEVRPRTFRVRCKDGSKKIINFRAVALATGDCLIFYEDITQRVQAQEALTESELRYRNLVEQIPAVTYIAALDEASTTQFISPQIEAILGVSPSEYAADPDTWRKRLHPQDRDRVLAEVARCHDTGEPFVSEYRMLARDGRIVWFRDEARLVSGAKGLPPILQGVMLDITNRKELEEALLQSELQYRTLVEQIPAMVYQGYPDWSMDCFDRKIEKLTGYPKEDFDARRIKWKDVIPEEEMDYVLQTFREALKTDKSYVREYRIRKKSGEYAWVHCRGRIFCDAEGKYEYVRGVVFDITKQKQMELALRRREAILEAVSFAAEKFLQLESWDKYIQNILERLGQSADAGRVYIFENHLNESGDLITSQRYEWVAPGIKPQKNNLKLQNLSWQEAGFGRWKEQLSQGHIIVGHVREFPPSEQELLASQEIKSIVVVPFFVGHEWWGIIGFDDCLNEREWSPVELEALKTAASTLGAAILRERVEQALRISEKKLRSLASQLLTAQENERKRLAGELHDELGHALLTLKLSIKSLEKQLSSEHLSFTREFIKIDHFIFETIKEVRRLYHDLSPGDLEDLGLTESLRDMIEDVASLQEEITWSVRLDQLDGLFPLTAQTAIYRVVQEALTNIGKHARATNVSIIAKRENRGILINIEDNGRGFEAANVLDAKKSLGLLTMEERVKILGGFFTLWSQENQGTRVSFFVPIPEED